MILYIPGCSVLTGEHTDGRPGVGEGDELDLEGACGQAGQHLNLL